MLTNAKLIRIDRLTGAAATGQGIYSTGPTIAVDCFACGIKTSQRSQLGAIIKDATGVLYVDKNALVDAGEVAPGICDELVFELGSQAAQTREVVTVGDNELEGVSHWECFLLKV